MSRRLLGLILLLASTIIVTLVVTLSVKVPLPSGLKDLAKYYVAGTIGDTASPEAVAAIVWDYRGLDTVYETSVLYLAIVGGLAIFRVSKWFMPESSMGLTILSRTSTKLVVLLISTVAIAISLHGHLTPGGGFPGGSALAVAVMLLVPIFSVKSLLERGITSTRLVAIRGLALTALGLVAILPVIKGLEVVTNQRFYPPAILGLPISGSISMYNLCESLAVASGFSAIILYLSLPEEAFKGELQ